MSKLWIHSVQYVYYKKSALRYSRDLDDSEVAGPSILGFSKHGGHFDIISHILLTYDLI